MASLTIRKLDEGIKSYLRLRAAGNGRSVEEEVRVILGEYTEGRLMQAGAAPPQPGLQTPAPAAPSRATPRPARSASP